LGRGSDEAPPPHGKGDDEHGSLEWLQQATFTNKRCHGGRDAAISLFGQVSVVR
jgi:hypothetical protein